MVAGVVVVVEVVDGTVVVVVVDVEVVVDGGVVVVGGEVVLGGEVELVVLPAPSHALAEDVSLGDVPIGAATTTEPPWSEIA